MANITAVSEWTDTATGKRVPLRLVDLAGDGSAYGIAVSGAGATGASADRASASAQLLATVGTSADKTQVKAGAGTLFTVTAHNVSAADAYLKLYDELAAAVTVGTTVPFRVERIPAGGSCALDYRRSFATGLTFAITTTAALAGSTGVAAGAVVALNVDYA